MMFIPLHGWRRPLWFASTVFLTLGYVFLTGKEFLASFFAARGDQRNLERAVRMSPGNADYRHSLGRYYAIVTPDPRVGIDTLSAATRINPHKARYWLDLAAAYQLTGNQSSQRAALEEAVKAEPTAPDVAWEAANFFLVTGDIDGALGEFRVVVEDHPYLGAAALESCWRVRPDTDALLRDVVPSRTDSLLAFLTVVASHKDVDGVIKVWNRLLELHQKFDVRYLLEQVRFLISARRPDAALEAWEKTVGLLNLSSYAHNPDNLIVNGDFALGVLNGGFDWTYAKRTGVGIVLDHSDLHQGQRSLSITFEGPGISDVGIQQYIPVRGGSTYEFSAYYKTADFQGAGGPQVVLRDPYTNTVVFTSDVLNDADYWKKLHAIVTTPESSTLLSLSIERTPAGSPIRGKLSLEDFQLSPADSEDAP